MIHLYNINKSKTIDWSKENNPLAFVGHCVLSSILLLELVGPFENAKCHTYLNGENTFHLNIWD